MRDSRAASSAAFATASASSAVLRPGLAASSSSAGQYGERRPQLVAGVRDKRSLPGKRTVQTPE